MHPETIAAFLIRARTLLRGPYHRALLVAVADRCAAAFPIGAQCGEKRHSRTVFGAPAERVHCAAAADELALRVALRRFG